MTTRASDSTVEECQTDELSQARLRAATRLAHILGKPPPTLEEALLDEALGYIAFHERNFAESGNPMYPCLAYVKARAHGIALPEWVLGYLDEALSDFSDAYHGFLSGEAKNDPTGALAVAFRFSKGKGESTVWKETMKDESYYEAIGDIILNIAGKRSRDGKTFNISGLIAEVMELQSFKHLSNRAGWRAWRKYKRVHPERAASLAQLRGFRAQKRTRTNEPTRIATTAQNEDLAQ